MDSERKKNLNVEINIHNISFIKQKYKKYHKGKKNSRSIFKQEV